MTNKDLFPRVPKGEAIPESAEQTAIGIRRKIDEVNTVAVLREELDRFVPDGHAQAALRIWAATGVILPGKDAEHHTKQIQVAGMKVKRPSFVCFRTKDLRKLVPSQAK